LSDICITDVISIEEVSTEEYNVNMINSIDKRYGALRQKSKAPT